jgi:8-oxo-dGTP diphosphatase
VPFTYAYPRPAVTVDAVIFTMRAEDLAVLLVKRGKAPFERHWALPGGFVDEHESLERAIARELEEETGIREVAVEQLGAFGDPARDPRGHTVSVAYFSFVVAESHRVRAGDDAAEVKWIPLRDLALEASVASGGNGATGATSHGSAPRGATKRRKLAFDHARIILAARDRLQERLHDPRRLSAFEIVPPRFTLTELQRVYEAVFGRSLDKRNFRARVMAQGLVEPVSSARRTGRHRPAQLYRWRHAKKGR